MKIMNNGKTLSVAESCTGGGIGASLCTIPGASMVFKGGVIAYSDYIKEDVLEVVLPAFEGEMGILKDHISIISFLKPGIIKILSKSGDENYFVEDGIVEFKNNNLSILTSSIFNLTEMDKSKQQDLLKLAEEEANKSDINDQSKYLVDQKIEVLKSLN